MVKRMECPLECELLRGRNDVHGRLLKLGLGLEPPAGDSPRNEVRLTASLGVPGLTLSPTFAVYGWAMVEFLADLAQVLQTLDGVAELWEIDLEFRLQIIATRERRGRMYVGAVWRPLPLISGYELPEYARMLPGEELAGLRVGFQGLEAVPWAVERLHRCLSKRLQEINVDTSSQLPRG